MDAVEQAKLYAEAWETWGPEKQMDMLIEEMAELTQAILKARRNGVIFSHDVFEEIADVGICMGQVEQQIKRIGKFPQVLKMEEDKLIRLRNRLIEEGES